MKRLPHLMAIALTLTACGDVFGARGSEPDDGPNSTATGGIRFQGVVFSAADGTPVPDVEVFTESQVVSTDTDGSFDIQVEPNGSTHVAFAAPNAPPVYRTVEPGEADIVYDIILIHEFSLTETFDPSEPQTFTMGAGEPTIEIPADALVLSDGSAPPADVTVEIAFVDAESAAASPPAPLVAMEDGQIERLVSAGMVDITATAGDEPLEVSKPLTVRWPTTEGDDAIEADLDGRSFSFDADEGLWVEEGDATIEGGAWTFEVTHLSWWNADAFIKVPVDQRACIEIRVENPDRTGLKGAVVVASWGLNNRFTARGSTSREGTLCSEEYPTGEEIRIETLGRTFSATTAEPVVVRNVVANATGASCGEPTCQLVTLRLPCDGECPEPFWVGNWRRRRVTQGGATVPGSDEFELTAEISETTYVERTRHKQTDESCESTATLEPDGDEAFFLTLVESDCPDAGEIGSSSRFTLRSGDNDTLIMRGRPVGGGSVLEWTFERL